MALFKLLDFIGQYNAIPAFSSGVSDSEGNPYIFGWLGFKRPT